MGADATAINRTEFSSLFKRSVHARVPRKVATQTVISLLVDFICVDSCLCDSDMESCKPNVLMDELTCPVCYEVFSVGRMPIIFFCCQQVYCQRCVEHLQICPTCRTETCESDQRPCRKLLSILDCLCGVCHRCEKDRSCVDCKLNLCDNCLGQHLIVHETDIVTKRAELKEVLETAQTFIAKIKDGLSDLRAMIDKKLVSISSDVIKIDDDTKKRAGPGIAKALENTYVENLNEIHRLKADISNHIIPVLINVATEMKVPVPSLLTDFNRKPIFQSMDIISNVDIALPPDAVSFINAVSVDQVLSQIIDQPAVDKRHLLNKSGVQFQLLPDEVGTCNIVYKTSVILATNRARVIIFKDGKEMSLPCVDVGNNHPISGLTVVSNADGTKSILAVDCSNQVYEHSFDCIEGKWELAYIGEEDVEFNDVEAQGDTVFLIDNTTIHSIAWPTRNEQSMIELMEEEHFPKQLIIIRNKLVLLRFEHQKYVLLKSLDSDIEGDKMNFNFIVHHMQYNDERRILAVIGHHEASDHFALHTFAV